MDFYFFEKRKIRSVGIFDKSSILSGHLFAATPLADFFSNAQATFKLYRSDILYEFLFYNKLFVPAKLTA